MRRRNRVPQKHRFSMMTAKDIFMAKGKPKGNKKPKKKPQIAVPAPAAPAKKPAAKPKGR